MYRLEWWIADEVAAPLRKIEAASVSGRGKDVKCRRRDAGTEPERNVRRQTAGGSTPIIRLKQMPLVTSALSAERNRRGREGNRADHQAGEVKQESALVTAEGW